ncbi:MAG: PilT/PilU family type 4a pilus ATPase [Opitutales bacterium]|nr:PilT/PilU family type 4a pilus ATPase [Opitutales bacterium]MCH8539719.1 PilT/PilU family type 4a pilus ATPase [Opitutales bacterium]
MISFSRVIQRAVEMGASDVHLIPHRPPSFRIDGCLVSQKKEFTPLSPQEVEDLLFPLLGEEEQSYLAKEWELDVGIAQSLEDGSQVQLRSNLHRQSEGWGGSFRIIPRTIPTPEEITLEPSVRRLAEMSKGLVLVTGPTGCGKTTTLATLLELINQKQQKHILTIEDPIEYILEPKESEITQRELGQDTRNFQTALLSALRSDPDVLFIGEMRDRESMQLALTASETGQLVFSTLHTSDASQTIDRIIDIFPAEQQAMVRSQLANVLQAVVAQILLPRAEGSGRIASREILMGTNAVRTLIRENQNHQLYGTISTGSEHGMQTMEKSLLRLCKEGKISEETVHSSTNRKENMKSSNFH